MENIKNFRLEIDKYINSIQFLTVSREVSLANTNLQRSKMWLGKALGEMGSATPYPQSDNAKNNVIEKQAEHTEDNLSKEFSEAMTEGSHRQTTMVKVMRAQIQVVLDGLMKLKVIPAPNLYQIYLLESILALEESKMWLGMELNNIRNKTGRVEA